MSDLERWSRPWLARGNTRRRLRLTGIRGRTGRPHHLARQTNYSERERQKNDANYLPY